MVKNIFNEKQTFASLHTFAKDLVSAEEGYITTALDKLNNASTGVQKKVTDRKAGLEGQKTTAEDTIKKAKTDKKTPPLRVV